VLTEEDTGSFSFRRPIIIAATLLALYAAYVFIQYRRLNSLNQRALANIAAELSRAIETAIGTVKLVEGKPDSGARTGPSRECLFDQDQPYLEFFPDCEKAAGFLLKVDFETANGLVIAKRNTEKDSVELRFRGDAVLGELFPPEAFRLLLIVGDDGQVLYQDEPERRQWGRWLRWGEQRFTDATADRASAVRIQNLSAAFPEGGEADWKKVRSKTSRTTLSLGGDWYQVYSQPVTLAADKNITLVGAVPADQLVWKALVVDNYFLALLVFLLLLGVSAIPFVKLIALDKHERFRMRDVYFLYLSSGALLAVLTFFVMGQDASREWGRLTDAGLKPLAEGLRKQFQKEVGAVRDQLADYDHSLSESVPRTCSTWDAFSDWFNTEKQDGKLLPLSLKDRDIYVETAAWLSPGGRQEWKATASKIATKLSVAQRPYYLAVRDGYLYKMGTNETEFFISPGRSISDGKFKTFLSMPSVNQEFCSEGKGRYTAVAVAKLLSLDRVPLPAGYGFVIVNREGGALYHSDSRLSLRENFFSEISIASTVKAFMYAAHPQKSAQGNHERAHQEPLRGRYRERPHTFWIEPLGIRLQSDDTTEALHLVVFRDRSVGTAMVAHAFVIGIAVTVIVLFVVVLLAIPLIPKLRQRSVWLWPHGGLPHYHRSLALAFGGVLIAAFVLSQWFPEVIFLLPPATLVAGVGVALSQDPKTERRKMQDWKWHDAEILLMASCIVIFPSATLFRLTLNHHLGRSIVTERKWIQDQIKDLDLAVRADERAEGYPEWLGNMTVRARQAYFFEDPLPYKWEGKHAATASSSMTTVHSWFDGVLPTDNDTITRYRYQDISADDSPPSILPGIGRLGLAGMGITLGLLWFWVRWNTKGIFYADLESSPPAPLTNVSQCVEAWKCFNDEERILLLQISRERIANPRQKPVVAKLLDGGWLRLAPDLQPATDEFAGFLRVKEQEMKKELRDSERVSVRHSWRYVRLILFIGLVGLGLFLGATQPGWQSALLGFASATTGLLSAVFKLQDTVLQWIKKSPASS
jgi:hypothetical protein